MKVKDLLKVVDSGKIIWIYRWDNKYNVCRVVYEDNACNLENIMKKVELSMKVNYISVTDNIIMLVIGRKEEK